MDGHKVTEVVNTFGTQPPATSNANSDYGSDKLLRGREMAGSMDGFDTGADEITTHARQGGTN